MADDYWMYGQKWKSGVYVLSLQQAERWHSPGDYSIPHITEQNQTGHTHWTAAGPFHAASYTYTKPHTKRNSVRNHPCLVCTHTARSIKLYTFGVRFSFPSLRDGLTFSGWSHLLDTSGLEEVE